MRAPRSVDEARARLSQFSKGLRELAKSLRPGEISPLTEDLVEYVASAIDSSERGESLETALGLGSQIVGRDFSLALAIHERRICKPPLRWKVIQQELGGRNETELKHCYERWLPDIEQMAFTEEQARLIAQKMKLAPVLASVKDALAKKPVPWGPHCRFRGGPQKRA